MAEAQGTRNRSHEHSASRPEEEQLSPSELAAKEAYEANILASLSAIDRQHAPIPNVSKRIHIVGTGSIGKLVAHSLRGIPDAPPVTLLFHRYKLLLRWRRSPQQITVQDGDFEVPRGGFDYELQPTGQQQHGVDIPHGTPDIFELSDAAGVKPHEAAEIVAAQRAEEKPREEEAKAKFEPIEGEVYRTAKAKDESTKPLNKAAGYLPDDIIHNLIVCTKTVRTVVALSRLKHRLNAESTICFLQNGMGVIDDVNAEVFPDPKTRPNYVQGVITHGANSPPERAEREPFLVVHAGHGSIALGIVPREPPSSGVEDKAAQQQQQPAPEENVEAEAEVEEEEEDWKPDSDTSHSYSYSPPPPTSPQNEKDDTAAPLGHLRSHYPQSARYLIRTLTRTPVLAAVAHTPHELLQLQLEKLAVNSVLNPLTSLIDARNGSLLANHELLRTLRLMLAETSLIIRSLPELRGLPNTNSRFSAARLERLVLEVAHKTRDNVSSMLADVRAGRLTEVGYINGYIVKRGEELGVKAVVNYSMMCLVQGKRRVVQREGEGEVAVRGEMGGLNVDL